MKLNDKSTIRAWAMFDWSNSAYNLVITSTIFPAYYTAITTTQDKGDQVNFFGFQFINTALANYSLACAYLIMAIVLPVLSAIADNRGNKKSFMKVFTYLGGLSCIGLFFFKLDTLEWGIICSTLAAMGYIGGVLFNNSYLPEIASIDEQDRVSAQGFAYGYIGSVLLQIICFVFVLKPEWFGIQDATFAPRLSFLLVGLWWMGFSQIPFKKLPSGKAKPAKINTHILRSGFNELNAVWIKIKGLQNLKKFLGAFFFYAMGVQTTMLVAAAFGEKVLHLGASKLIATILIIQLVAIVGAFLMSTLAKRMGNVRVLIIAVLLWIVVCFSAYLIQTETQFYILAALVGLIMGGIQSLSRSTYSKLIPREEEDTTAFFSFYDVTEKLAIVIGLFFFAFIEEQTKNIRYSALSLALFFGIGMFFLIRLLRQNNKENVSLN
ncbi:MFS transporter [Olivibacter sp. 47]|uniref:MFS transporter n=1 Tax=Olivibacter sp. 47 TaxID=3056486 RepID=UPI0025A37DA2|nr:MFS transporter [Olivibacter sp. 47]MDM8174731.1 MFS transporter [Olivibacter sp. 47]